MMSYAFAKSSAAQLDFRVSAVSDQPSLASLFSDGYKATPYWWDHVKPPSLAPLSTDITVDVAIIGSGYTGLNAALQTARGGRSTLVLDAEDAGWGCSTRNGGQISTSIKPTVAKLARKFNVERAKAIHGEGTTALEWIAQFVNAEGIDCDFRHAGRFHAAHSPAQYDSLSGALNDPDYGEDTGAYAVSRAEQTSELGSEIYHGGIVYPKHCALHPAKYHTGLLSLVLKVRATVAPRSPVLSVERGPNGFTLKTPHATVTARDVIVATNGYTGTPFGWLRRRVIPIGSYIIATEPLAPAVMDELFPTDRIASDTRRVVYYYRPSPDRTRVVFGGRVSANETDPNVSGPRLHDQMLRIFPQLSGTKISHSWAGMVAYSFDEMAHTGTHDGIHYAMSYCGSGVSMASYLGMRMGQRVLGLSEGKTAFDDLPFPTRPLYTGKPWFLPTVVSAYRWLDDREFRRDEQKKQS